MIPVLQELGKIQEMGIPSPGALLIFKRPSFPSLLFLGYTWKNKNKTNPINISHYLFFGSCQKLLSKKKKIAPDPFWKSIIYIINHSYKS